MKNIESSQAYVYEQLKNGATPRFYKKYARVQAEQGVVGQEVVTVMKNGLEETRNTVTADENGNPGWIVTNPSGEKYIVPHAKFIKRYELQVGADGKHAPTGAPIEAIQIHEDITVTASWGEEQNIKANGYLNISNLEDIYGIQEEEFKETYAPCDENGIFEDRDLRIAFGQEDPENEG